MSFRRRLQLETVAGDHVKESHCVRIVDSVKPDVDIADNEHTFLTDCNDLQQGGEFIVERDWNACDPGRYTTTIVAAKDPSTVRAAVYSNVDGASTATVTGVRRMPWPATMATPPWFTDRSSAFRGLGLSTT